MTRDQCWNVARDGHDHACPVGREERRILDQSQRLLASVSESSPVADLERQLEGWTESERRLAFGDR